MRNESSITDNLIAGCQPYFVQAGTSRSLKERVLAKIKFPIQHLRYKLYVKLVTSSAEANLAAKNSDTEQSGSRRSCLLGQLLLKK